MKVLLLGLALVFSSTSTSGQVVTGRWSDADDQIRGRIVIEYERDFTAPKEVFVELTCLGETRALWIFGRVVRIKLQDATGKVVREMPQNPDKAWDSPEWIVLAPGESVRLRVSGRMPLAFWRLAPGARYLLSAAAGVFAPLPPEGTVPPARLWTGRLFFPGIRVPPERPQDRKERHGCAS